METTYIDPQAELNANHGEQINYGLIIYGTDELTKQQNDTVSAALCRYMKDTGIGNNKLARLTGISKGTISRYCNGTAKYNPNFIYAICIALRLRTCCQRHLLVMLEIQMPDERGANQNRAFIIREHLDYCFKDSSYTVISCNQRLIDAHKDPLTSLTSEMEGK